MTMDMGMRPEMDLSGGMTESVFAELNKVLEDEKVQEILLALTRPKDQEKYDNLSDLLYGEVFDCIYDAKKACENYYTRRGPKLVGTISVKDVRQREAVLLLAVRTAVTWRRTCQRLRWPEFRRCVIDIARSKKML